MCHMSMKTFYKYEKLNNRHVIIEGEFPIEGNYFTSTGLDNEN